jgi:putative transposase
MKQITKENKEGCAKDRSGKKNDKNENKEKRKVGRPKGSTNKDKSKVKLSKYFSFVQDTLTEVLNIINKSINITYFVFDGEFGNNNAAQMILQKGLQLISKLRQDSALYFKYKGENKRKKYGDKIDYDNIPDKYLVKRETDKNGLITKIFQMEMLHKTFPKPLNIVVIVKFDAKNNRKSHVVLFSTDLKLVYENLIKYYSLRFQIEFIFRDAKQHWGLEDFMNIKEKPVNNFANLSTFMVNFSYLMREKFGDEKMSIINLKLRFHGMKYVDKVLKLLPKKPDDISLNQIYNEIANIGSIEKEKKAS